MAYALPEVAPTLTPTTGTLRARAKRVMKGLRWLLGRALGALILR